MIKFFLVYIDKFIYKFTYYDFLKIINSSLLNYDETFNENLINSENFLFNPLKIKNPYTNVIFKKNVLYNFYIFLLNNNLKIPLLLQLFYYSDFNIQDFVSKNENFATRKSLNNYVKNLSLKDKHKLLLQSINLFNNFITKNFDGFTIKYLTLNFKNKFNNLPFDKINYYDNIIYNYLLSIYFFNTKQYKNYINNKIKSSI